MNQPVRLKPIIFIIFLLIILSDNTLLKAQNVACYIHKRAVYSYVYGFGDDNNIHYTEQSYIWSSHNAGDNLSFNFSGLVCSHTLHINVRSSGTDSDDESCFVNNEEQKGGDMYSVNSTFYSIPGLSTGLPGNSICVSYESVKCYTFTANTSHVLYTDRSITGTYLQIANNINFSGANTIALPGGTATLSYSDLAGSQTSAWYGSPLYYRLRFRMSNGNYMSGPILNQIQFFPNLELPSDVTADLPDCYGGSPKINIPVSNTEQYIITIQGVWEGAQGLNFNTANLIPNEGYYVITNSTETVNQGQYPDFEVGKTYIVKVEQSHYNGQQTTPCADVTSVPIPPIPPFTLTFTSYGFKGTDNDDNSVQISIRGNTGRVNMRIVGSKTQTVTANYGGSTKSVSLSPYNSEGSIYHRGNFYVDLPAGTHNVYISNAGCNSNTVPVSLNQPTPITFSLTSSVITCHTSGISGTENDGTITINNPGGGIGNYTYSHTVNGSIIRNLSYLSAGHVVRVTDAYNNSTSHTKIVPQNTALDFTVGQETAPTHSCIANGTATASNPSGGTGGYGYSQVNESGTFSDETVIDGYTQGTHPVYMKDNSGCVISRNASIPNAPPEIYVSPSSESYILPSCMDYFDGEYHCTVSNVSGILSISDTDPYISPDNITITGSNISITELSANNYTFEITDTYSGNSCSIQKPFTILPKDTITINSSITHVSDKGTATGAIEIQMSSGNSGLRKYILFDENRIKLDSISSESNTASFTDLSGESENEGKAYYIDIIDINSCSFSEDNSDLYLFRIQEPTDTLKIDFNITDSVDCHSYNNGTIVLSAEGGWTEFYEYSTNKTDWTTDNTFSGYAEGSYFFYVKDLYGGTDSVQVYFSQPVPLTAVHDSTFNVLCNGTNTGWLRYKVSGGTFPYTFVQNQSDISSVNGEDTLLTATGLISGTYRLNIEDRNGCVTPDLTNFVSEPDELTVPYISVKHTSCELENGALDALASGGTIPYNYRWENLNTSTIYNHSNYQVNDTSKITGLPAGEYQLQVTDSNNCLVINSLLDVNSYTNPVIINDQTTDVRCYSESNGEIAVTANEGTSSIQNYTIEAVSSAYNDSNVTGTFTGLLTDTFLLYVFDSNGCISNNPFPVIVNQPDTTIYTITDTIVPVMIKGSATGRIHAQIYGGNDGLKDISLFDSDNIFIDEISERNKFPVQFDSLYTGDYYFSIIDRKGCTYSSPLQTVPEPQSALGFNVIEKNNAMCKAQTGSFIVEGYGGWGDYSYKRAVYNGFYNINTFENLYAGSYIVSVKDKYGAVFTDTVLIYEPKDSLQVKLIDYSDPICNNNGSISVNMEGGTAPYKLFFDNSADTIDIPSPQDYSFANRPEGAYLLHVTDSNECKFDMETELSGQNLIQISDFELTYPSSEGISNGQIEATVKGGQAPLDFSWREIFGQALSETSSVLANVPSGHYELSVSEAGGCSVSERIFLPDILNTALDIVELQHETSYQAQNGYAHLFANIDTLVNVEFINPQGERTIYDINDSTALFYEENNNIYLRNLSGGEYFVSTTNTQGDKAYTEFQIQAYEQFYFKDIIISHVKEINASNGSVDVVVKGGAGGNRFVWEYLDNAGSPLDTVNNEYTGAIRNALAGNYSITVTDKYNNSISQTIVIEQPAEPLEITISENTNESCKDYEDAYVILQAAGGWGDYQFRHDTEEYYFNSNNRFNLDVREHYFYLTDKTGATDSIAISITEPDYLRANTKLIDSVDCKNAADGNILFNITGGTEPYRYAFENQPDWLTQDTTARNLSEGTYSFIFTDNNNCIGQDTVTAYMPEPDSLLFNNIAVVHTTCDTDNGSIRVIMQGGTSPCKYEWTNFDADIIGTENIVSGLRQNSRYYLNVLDAHNCSQYYEQYINPSTNPLILDVDTTPALCNGAFTGTARIIDVLPAEPFAPYFFTWSNSDTGESADGFEAGVHTVTITDENNCSATKFFEVTEPDTLQLTLIDYKDAHCFGYNDGFIEISASGGVGNFSYSWDNGGTAQRADSLHSGTCELTLTDSNNCSIKKTYEIIEPNKLTVDLGRDIEICPGSSITIDGQEFTSYQWSSGEGVFSNERFVTVRKEDEYSLKVTNDIGCFGYDAVSVSIGEDALNADFLMSSQSVVGDTVFIYEISDMSLDSIYWDYNEDAFTDITDSSLPSYIIQLLSNETGVYNVGLSAYSGGCISTVVKQIEIIQSDSTGNEDDFFGYTDPLILNVSVYPNPTDGNFTVEVELRETADINIKLFNVNFGLLVDQREERGLDNYEIKYNLNFTNTGVYVIMVTAEKERKQTKIIIK